MLKATTMFIMGSLSSLAIGIYLIGYNKGYNNAYTFLVKEGVSDHIIECPQPTPTPEPVSPRSKRHK